MKNMFRKWLDTNFGSLHDIYGFLNVVKNKYSVNQAVDV